MNTKHLRRIRKYYDYRFCEGKLIVRHKASGCVSEHAEVSDFVEDWCHETIGWFTYSNHKERKQRRIDERSWKDKWEKAINCSAKT